jgi:bisanhydrobacterioruberin hydratase
MQVSRHIPLLVVIYYAVGIIGFLITDLQPIMILLTPFTLLVTAVLLFWHHVKWRINDLMVFLFIAFSSFFVEMAGTQTGLIFGSYQYGKTLGWQIAGTPLLIGLNWWVLTYCFHAILLRLKLQAVFHVLLGALGMTFFDWVMEPAAVKTGMWYWENNIIPIQNYVAWFGLAFVYFALLKYFKVMYVNSLAVSVLLCQFALFVALRWFA